MTRPLYETEKDRKRAEHVATVVADQLHLKDIAPAKLLAPINFIGEDIGGDIAIEVKTTRHPMVLLERWGGVMVSKRKWQKIRELCEGYVPFWYVIEAAGDIYVARIPSSFDHDGEMTGGRTDRGDRRDVEPMVLLKARRFERLAV